MARKYGADREVVIASWDSDLWQLVTDKVTVLRYRGRNSVICDRAYIQNRLGIGPEQYADHKSLTGDQSDNIRGAEKVGPKTAAALLGQFGSLEEILERVEQIRKPSVRESIRRSGPRLRTNKLLIRLDGLHPVPFAWEEMAWQYEGQTTTEVLQAIGPRVRSRSGPSRMPRGRRSSTSRHPRASRSCGKNRGISAGEGCLKTACSSVSPAPPFKNF